MQYNKFKLKNKKQILIYTFLISVILLGAIFTIKLFPFTSLGADATKVTIEASLEKYINYHLTEEDKGTLVQYKIKTKIEQEEVLPVDENKTIVNFGQINEQYPYEIKVITDDKIEYDASSGILSIQTNYQSETNYVVICYYDTYTEDNDERELEIKVSAESKLGNEEEKISSEEQYRAVVTENRGDLTSIDCETEDIYNGYLKSNIINGTEYETQYEQMSKIMISKKEAQDTIEMIESNTFIKTKKNSQDENQDVELGNYHNLVYESTQIQKTDMQRILGEEGRLEILDTDENVIATIDQNTEFEENGTYTIVYENEPETITVRTSHIMDEGKLNLKHIKKIKSTMKSITNTKIKTEIQMNGMKEEKEQQVYVNSYEKVVDIKEARNNVNISLNSTEWTNEQQNEVTFDVSLNTHTEKDNLFKNPSLYIELPKQVEKVILGNSSILYANGLELQDPYLEKNENGNLVIVVNLFGEQLEYNESALELTTDIKIVATVILNKDMEGTEETVKVAYTNQYTLNDGVETENKEIPVYLESYQEEKDNEVISDQLEDYQADNKEIVTQTENYQEKNEEIATQSDNYQEESHEVLNQLENTHENSDTIYSTRQLKANSNDLKMEITPTKGNTILKNGDIVYEGEYIKYNIKITNTSERDIDNVTVVASIPDGVTYGELETDYYDYMKPYKYNFKEEDTEKTINIGTVKAGKSTTIFYEVKANDLSEREKTKEIVTEISCYEGEELLHDYKISNSIKPSEVQLFMGEFLYYDGWNYYVNLKSEKQEEVTVNIHLPQGFKVETIKRYSGFIQDPSKDNISAELLYEDYAWEEIVTQENIKKIEIEISDDNVLTAKLKTNSCYSFCGRIDETKIKKQSDVSTIELASYAEAVINGNTYTSNENRIEVLYHNISVSMTSDNEGEKVKYEDEVNYEITIKNIGGANVATDELVKSVIINVKDFLPKEIEPISVTYDTWEHVEKEVETYLEKKENITQDISGISTDENGNELANVDISILIPKGESVTIKIKATAGIVYKETKIENNATISGDKIDTKISNTIIHTILPYDYEEEEDNVMKEPEDVENPQDREEPEDVEKSQDSEEPEDTKEQDNSNYSQDIKDGQISKSDYIISGIAWVDENEDGKRTSEEKLLQEITVMLIDISNSSTVKSTTRTSNDGAYQFSNLDKGNYLVIFQYDIDTYRLTEYQKNGISTSFNSDVMTKTVTLYGEKMTVGITDTIELNTSISNLDIGLIENKFCDFKIDKYISKVTVNTINGTKEYSYGNAKLAKTEIKAKEMENATVIIEYKIIVTNNGQIAGTINKIVDYLPEGLNFSSDLNTNWVKNTNGELMNTSISNQEIAAGKSIELTFFATKQMKSDSTGTFTNKVKIEGATSIAGTIDQNIENNISNADVIISVGTGMITYISIVILVLIILSLVVIYLYKNGKINIKKTSKITFISMFVLIMLLTSPEVWGEYMYTANRTWNWHKHVDPNCPDEYNCVYFREGPGNTGDWGVCNNHGVDAACSEPTTNHYNNDSARTNPKNMALHNCIYEYYGTYNSILSKPENSYSGGFTLKKTNNNSDVKMETVGNDYKYGPFKINCSSTGVNYTIIVKDKNNQDISGAELCDETSNANGDITFYIKISKNNCNNGVSKFTLIGKKARTKTTKQTIKSQVGYKSTCTTYNTQIVLKSGYTITETLTNTTSENYSISRDWTMNYGGLLIKKVDNDDTNKVLANVKFKIRYSNKAKYMRINDETQHTGTINVNSEANKKESLGTTLITDNNGEILITNLKAGKKYKMKETSYPGYGYEKSLNKQYETPKVVKGMITTFTIKNTKNTGNLQIIKEDKDSHKKLKDVTFKIKVKSTNQYIKAIDSTGEKTIVTGTVNLTSLGFKNNRDDGTIFKTDADGIIRINNLLTDTYIIEEVENPNGYGYTQKVTEEVTVTRKKTTETTVQVKTIPNEEQTGNLRISKIDTDSGKKLAGVTFKIKNSQGKYIQAVTEQGIQTKVDKSILLKDLKYTDKENEATEFITNEEGIIEIHKLLIDTYEVIEISLGEENSNYEIDDNYISWESNVNKNGKGRVAQVKVERQSSENTQDTISNYVTLLTIKNKKKYIDIKGYVWLDIEGYSKSEYQTNGHYRADENDINDRLLEGMTVQLKDEKGQTVQLKNKEGEFVDAETTTDENGEYSFQKVEIKEIEYYQVKFTYNGMSYQAVEKDLQKEIEREKRNGSTGEEIDEEVNRDQFNESYETITYGKSNQYDLAYKYDETKYESKLLYGDEKNYNYGHNRNKEEGRDPVSGVDKQYIIRAVTKLVEIISSEEINKNDTTEVANINLGIKRRAQPNLGLGKELNSVKVSINGENHVYQYVDRYNASKDKDRMDPQVKFEKIDGTYTRPVYASDVYYEGENPLQVKVTYKIRVSLDSCGLTSKVNEITDYYDKKYFKENDKVKVGKEIDKNGDIKEENQLDFEFDEEYSGNESYYKMKIKNPCTLTCSNDEKERNEALIYVQLEVKPENIKELLEEQNKLYNQAEITSYSTYQNDKPYAGIDPDSQPGNFEIGNRKTYEDDNDMVPGLQIILQDERKTDGNVFMDEIEKTNEFNPDGLNTAKIRQGSGIYEAKEKGVSGVTVQLVEVDANTGEMKGVAQVYNQTTKQWVKAEDITDENGEYTIAGFIPGYYKIVYIWGGQTYIKQTGEEQKIRVQDYKGTVYLKQERQEHEEWYKTKEPRYSDAMDDYETRQMIDKQMTKITNANKHTIENYSGTLELSNGKDEEEIITKMDSGTPKFKVNIEYESKTEDDNGITKEYELNEDGSIRMNGIYAIKKEEYKNYLQHIDFGIVERAKQALSLSKKIQRLKITVTDGTILVNAKVKEDGTLENEVKHTVYIPKSEGANGQFKVEIDNEVIQGAQLEITYQFQVVNKSELDYVNEDYYWYGKGYGQNLADLVKLRASGLIDYLDNGLTVGQKQESEGNHIVQGSDQKGKLISDGLLENGQESKSILNQIEKILIKEFNKELTPIDNDNMEEKTFVTNKLLSNISTDDEMIFDNDAEIIEIMKTGGSSLVTMPGNYKRSESSKEMDNDTAESVIIIPPTGLTVNYIGYAILAITSLGVLIVGVILIRKFVLR